MQPVRFFLLLFCWDERTALGCLELLPRWRWRWIKDQSYCLLSMSWAIFNLHRGCLKGSFPLWSAFSYLELQASLSGSSFCHTGLILMSDGLSTSPQVQLSQLQQFTAGLKHFLIDIAPKVRSLSVLILQPIRANCTCAVWRWPFVNEGKQINRTPKVTGWGHALSEMLLKDFGFAQLCVDNKVWAAFGSHRRQRRDEFTCLLFPAWTLLLFNLLTHLISYIKPLQSTSL